MDFAIQSLIPVEAARVVTAEKILNNLASRMRSLLRPIGYITTIAAITYLTAACAPNTPPNTTPTPLTFKSGGRFCSAEVFDDLTKQSERKPVADCNPLTDLTCECNQ